MIIIYTNNCFQRNSISYTVAVGRQVPRGNGGGWTGSRTTDGRKRCATTAETRATGRPTGHPSDKHAHVGLVTSQVT